jgi:hypothetical protein
MCLFAPRHRQFFGNYAQGFSVPCIVDHPLDFQWTKFVEASSAAVRFGRSGDGSTPAIDCPGIDFEGRGDSCQRLAPRQGLVDNRQKPLAKFKAQMTAIQRSL